MNSNNTWYYIINSLLNQLEAKDNQIKWLQGLIEKLEKEKENE